MNFLRTFVSPLIVASLSAALVAGCRGTSSDGAIASPTPATPTPTSTATATATGTPAPLLAGQLVGGTGAYPGTIKGIHFRSATQSGFTDDAGTFRYIAGETVTFGVADVDFRPVAGAAMLSPWQLAGTGACTQGSDLVHLLVLLQSLDADGDPSTGTAVPEVAPAATQRALSSLTDADIATLIAQQIPGRLPVDAGVATDAFITQMDGELWLEMGADQFLGLTGLSRSQGAATDGTEWYFSWELGLERTGADFSSQKSHAPAIPAVLSALGDNHIGDIDWWNGTLYAPVEDGSAYVHPYIVKFDPTSLDAGATFALPNTMLTKGVPWVAVDGPRGLLYVAEWDPTPEILVFDLATITFLDTIPLRTTLTRIQGAKVFEGALYAATDDTAKDIYKINLETGTVIPLFAFNQTFEQEGLAFLARPDGSLLHTLNVRADKLGSEFRHHQRTRAPLRQSVCSAN